MLRQTVTDAEVVGDHQLRLRFDYGPRGVIDVEDRLWGPMFEALRDPVVSHRVRVDASSGTVTGRTALTSPPETLYREVRRWSAAT